MAPGVGARRSHSVSRSYFDSPVTRAKQISLTTAARSGRMRAMASDPQPTTADAEQRWLTPGVRGIGTASFLADVGHEIPTALLPNLLTATLGAPAAALGLIEGLSDGLAGAARLWPACRSRLGATDRTTMKTSSSTLVARTGVDAAWTIRAWACVYQAASMG
jgi:hypothetical protein